MKLLLFRLKIAFQLIRGKHENFMFISVTDKQVINFLSDKDAKYYKVTYRMPTYIFKKLVKDLSSKIDSTDLIIEKACFQAEFTE